MKITGFGGVVSGRKGDIIMYVRKGQTLGRQYQPHVNNPNTLNQQAARTKFRMLADLAAQAKHVTAIGFGEALSNRLASGYNLFIKYNPATVQMTNVNGNVDVANINGTLPNMVLSAGNMAGVTMSADFSTPNTVTVRASIIKQLHQETAAGMGVCFVVYVYCPDLKQGFMQLTRPVSYSSIMLGDDEAYSTTITAKAPSSEWQGLRVFAYGFGKLVPAGEYEYNRRYPAPASPTIYLGNAELA